MSTSTVLPHGASPVASRLGRGVIALALGLSAGGCEQAECANPDYTRAECRVLAQWERSAVDLAGGAHLEFVEPEDPEARVAHGLLREAGPTWAWARVAGAGPFRLRVDAERDQTLALELRNLPADAPLFVGPEGAMVELPPTPPTSPDASPSVTTRTLQLDLQAGQPQWVTSQRPCPTRYRLAFLGDIQTNPTQFERIVTALRDEAVSSEAAGAPLLALSLAGDLTENSWPEQFDRIDGILARSPVPVQVAPGNHDVYRRQLPEFTEHYGPGSYVSSVCGTRMVMLDTGSAQLAASIEARLPELFAKGEDAYLIITTHYPAYAALTGAGWSREDQAQHLLLEAAIAGADLLVAGHYHGVLDFEVRAADVRLREVIVGSGGASQGLGRPRYGYLRVEVSPEGLETCFVEVPPPGAGPELNPDPSSTLPLCDD